MVEQKSGQIVGTEIREFVLSFLLGKVMRILFVFITVVLIQKLTVVHIYYISFNIFVHIDVLLSTSSAKLSNLFDREVLPRYSICL